MHPFPLVAVGVTPAGPPPGVLECWTLRKDGDTIRCVPQIVGDRVNLRIESTRAIAIVQSCADGTQADAMSSTWRVLFAPRGWA